MSNTHLRDISRNQMVKSENAIGLLQSIGGLTSTDENINATYAALLSRAVQYGYLQLDLEHYETMLEMLDNKTIHRCVLTVSGWNLS